MAENPTLTDRVAAVSGGQDDRVAQLGLNQQPASMDLISQLVQLNQQQQELNQQQPATLGDDLTGLPGIIAALGAGGAALAGGQDQGGQAAAAFLQSFLGQRKQGIQAQNQALAGQKEMLNDAINQQRTRLTQLLQSQPDMFIDADTGLPAVDPRLLGYAATGLMIPIDPSANHAMKNRLKQTEALFDMGKTMFMEGDTAQMRAEGLRLIGQAHGVQFSEDMYRVAFTGNERDAYMQIIQDGYFTPTSVFNAMLHAQQNGLSLPQVADMFVKDTTTDAEGNVITMPQATLLALTEYGERLAADPALNDPSLSFREKVELAFPRDAKSQTLLLDRYDESGVSPELLARQMESSLSTIMTLDQFNMLDDDFLAPFNLSKTDPQWQTKLAVRFTEHLGPALQSLDRQQAAKSVANYRRRVVAAVQAQPGFKDAPIEAVESWALRLVLQMKSDYTTANGTLEYEKFNQALDKVMRNPRSALGSFKDFYTPVESE